MNPGSASDHLIKSNSSVNRPGSFGVSARIIGVVGLERFSRWVGVPDEMRRTYSSKSVVACAICIGVLSGAGCERYEWRDDGLVFDRLLRVTYDAAQLKQDREAYRQMLADRGDPQPAVPEILDRAQTAELRRYQEEQQAANQIRLEREYAEQQRLQAEQEREAQRLREEQVRLRDESEAEEARTLAAKSLKIEAASKLVARNQAREKTCTQLRSNYGTLLRKKRYLEEIPSGNEWGALDQEMNRGGRLLQAKDDFYRAEEDYRSHCLHWDSYDGPRRRTD